MSLKKEPRVNRGQARCCDRGLKPQKPLEETLWEGAVEG